MEKVALGPALPIPNGVEASAPIPIDLGAHQRAIVAQIQTEEGRLAILQREVKTTQDRITASRGKLDLLAELMQMPSAE